MQKQPEYPYVLAVKGSEACVFILLYVE